MVFEPGFLKVNINDTIIFDPADPSHNAESFFSPSPEFTFLTDLGVKTSVKMTHEGVYLYKCTPHFMLGMVGVIQVGGPINKSEALAAWESHQSSVIMNKERMPQYLAEIE